jgi:acyl dehydratase
VNTITGLEELQALLGEELGTSEWHEIDQEAVDEFARVTGDDQWIHVDRERAAASPFGTTIVHGYFTLALGPLLANEAVSIEGFDYGLNYGLNRVRFPAPLPVGSRVRLRATLTAIEDVPGGVQVTITHTFEREGGDKPVCVAETLGRLYGGSADAGR